MKNEYLSIIRKSFFFLSIAFLGKISTFLFFIYIGRVYGADVTGILSILIFFIEVVTAFCLLGLGMFFMKQVSILNQKNDHFFLIKSLYKKLISVLIFIGIPVSIIIYFFHGYIAELIIGKPEIGIYLKWTSFIILPMIFLQFHSRFLQGLNKINAYTFFLITSIPLFNLILILVLDYLISPNLENPIFTRLAACGLASLICFLSLYYLFFIPTRTSIDVSDKLFDTLSIKEILFKSNPFMVAQLLFFLNNGVGIIIISNFLTLSDTGIYSSAFRVSFYLVLIINSINAFVMPKFSSLWASKKKDELKNLYLKSNKFIFLTSFIIGSLAITMSSQILNLFGSEFVAGSNALRLLLMTQIINSFFGPIEALLSMTDNQKILSHHLLINLINNIVLSIVLVNHVGILGIAIAFLISRTFFLLSLTKVFYKKIGFYPGSFI